jgi:hypothetical protein
MIDDEHRRLFSGGLITGLFDLWKFRQNANVSHFDGFVGHFEVF